MFLNVLFTQHGCHLIVRGKRTMVRQILNQFDQTREQFQTGDRERTRLEDRMMEYTQLGNLAEYAFGRLGRWSIEMALAFTQCGFCVIYFIFIGSTIQQVTGMCRILRIVLFYILCMRWHVWKRIVNSCFRHALWVAFVRNDSNNPNIILKLFEKLVVDFRK